MPVCGIVPERMSKIAVIQTGGKQYVVAEGDTIEVEKLEGADAAGAKIKFDTVLMTDDGSAISVGDALKGVTVAGELIENDRTAKVRVMRYRAKSRYKKVYGHRQPIARVKITKIG